MIRTTNLLLGAFLNARGYPLLGTETDGQRVVFMIDAPENAARAFYGSDDEVSAKRLFECWRALRNLLPGRRR